MIIQYELDRYFLRSGDSLTLKGQILNQYTSTNSLYQRIHKNDAVDSLA